MKFLGIVICATGLITAYATAHDLLTIRLSPEYFTLHHPAIISSTSHASIALAWGLVVGVPAGLVIAFPLASAARHGLHLPKLSVRDLVSPLLTLLACMAAAAVLCGAVGFLVARTPLVAVRCAHVASYLAGAAGAVVLVGTTWRRRQRLAPSSRPLTRTP